MSPYSSELDPVPATVSRGLFRAYGLNWRSDVPLSLFEPICDSEPAVDVQVYLHAGEDAPERQVLIADGKIMIAADGLRYREGDIATMDVAGTHEISIYPGTQWDGVLPHSFFSTVAGALLALRGGVTIHGSAVEINGNAVVLCGPSGAGKSTTIAALIANGARLISDDLTVIEPLRKNTPAALYAGRRCIRLFPETAAALRRSAQTETLSSGGPKELVVAPRIDASEPVPLAGFLLLGAVGESSMDANHQILNLKLKELWFKPNVFPLFPGHFLRELALRAVLARSAFAAAPGMTFKPGSDLKVIAEDALQSWQRGRLPVQFM